jgi:hypothetical protein
MARLAKGLAAAFLLACAFLGPARADQSPMHFSVASLDDSACGSRCPRVLVADGVIEPETPLAFIDFATQAAATSKLRGVVLINSPGGNVLASMELGAAFRKLRIAAIVAGYASVDGSEGPVAGECVSACVYALMGAVRRVAPPVSRIALHRMSVTLSTGLFGGSTRELADQHLVALVARYARRMGVDPALVWTAEAQSPDNIHVLSPSEIRRWRLATSRF